MWVIFGAILFLGLVVVLLARGPRTPTAGGGRDPQSIATLPGGARVDVVGESHYQHAIERVVGGRTDRSAQHKCTALLRREPLNKFDSNAVAVVIDGATVGYLSRDDALLYGPALKLLDERQSVGACSAVIRGGWDRGIRGRGSFGVVLDLAEPSKIEASIRGSQPAVKRDEPLREVPTSAPGVHLLMGGKVVSAVGEGAYQSELAQVAATKSRRVTAILRCETPESVAIFIDSARVGQLSKPSARKYAPAIAAIEARNMAAGCAATIVGGSGGEPYGLKLDLVEPGSLDLPGQS